MLYEEISGNLALNKVGNFEPRSIRTKCDQRMLERKAAEPGRASFVLASAHLSRMPVQAFEGKRFQFRYNMSLAFTVYARMYIHVIFYIVFEICNRGSKCEGRIC
jgi:predicted lipase